MRFSSRVNAIAGKTVSAWDIHFAAYDAQKRGEDVILLSVGDPDLDTPAPVVEAAIAALRAGDTHYTDIPGRPALRAAIARDYQRRNAMAVASDNVIVFAGAQNALYTAAQCLFEPGDEVVALDPAYLTYQAVVGASGATLTRAAPSSDGRLRPLAASIAAAITPRTRALLFANPNNPSGVVMTRDELAAIAALAKQHDLWVIVDEVYAALTFERPHVAFAALPEMAARTVAVGSLSKSHAMTGWRCGWAIAPPELVRHMGNCSIAMVYGLPGFVMQGALEAVEATDAIAAEMRAIYLRRRELVYAALAPLPGLRCMKPEAGMFMLIDVRATGLDAEDFAWGLYREHGVSLIPASAFGACLEGHVRLCFAMKDERLEEACRRIARFVAAHRPALAAE